MKFEAFVEFVRKKLILTISGLILVVCASVYLLHMDKKADLDSEIEQLDIRMSAVLKNMKNSAGLEEDLVAVSELIEQLDTRLFDPLELATNYNYFYKIESNTGVSLSGLKQLEVKESETNKSKRRMPKSTKNSYQKIRYHMNATGEYGQIVNFMRELEGGSSFYRLEKFRLSRPKESEGEALSMDVSFLVLGRTES